MAKTLGLVGLVTLIASSAFAQTPSSRPPASALTTRVGSELNVSIQHYKYSEPDDVDISISGPKFGAEYTGTFSLSERRRWFGQFNLRGTGATGDYDGWCRPWQIEPSSTSANGYRLKLGDRSKCADENDPDFYVESRALTGKDFTGSRWAISPFTGVGFRHLSNGVTGNLNYRTQQYLYVPVGATLRTNMSGDRRLDFAVEYDYMLRGWQQTRQSLLGGGTVPATATAPSFSLGDFTDFSFRQNKGWALRAAASYRIARRWSIEPYFTRWQIDDSTSDDGSFAFTVNGITVRQAIGFYEPHNFTNEFGVKVGVRFGGK